MSFEPSSLYKFNFLFKPVNKVFEDGSEAAAISGEVNFVIALNSSSSSEYCQTKSSHIRH